MLEHVVLPELIGGDHAASLRAWSAGCSYGAEAFTLAAVCRRVLPGRPITILGTDIDERVVNRARTGVFSSTTSARRRWTSSSPAFEPTDEAPGGRARNCAG